MTKTQAAERLALHISVWARNAGQPVTRMLVCETMSQAISEGGHYGQCAEIANYKTVERLAKQMRAAY